MAEVELQVESEQLLQELAMQPSSVHKAPINCYQHYAMKCAQVEWKEQVAESEDQYVAALRTMAEHLKHNKMKRINSF